MFIDERSRFYGISVLLYLHGHLELRPEGYEFDACEKQTLEQAGGGIPDSGGRNSSL
jgi:hypothetical protein